MSKIFSRSLISYLLILSIFAAALPLAGYAQTTPPAAVQTGSADQTKGLAAIEEKAEARRKELGIPGMALVIVHDGKVIYSKGLGYKDFEKKVPVTPEYAVRHRIGHQGVYRAQHADVAGRGQGIARGFAQKISHLFQNEGPGHR